MGIFNRQSKDTPAEAPEARNSKISRLTIRSGANGGKNNLWFFDKLPTETPDNPAFFNSATPDNLKGGDFITWAFGNYYRVEKGEDGKITLTDSGPTLP